MSPIPRRPVPAGTAAVAAKPSLRIGKLGERRRGQFVGLFGRGGAGKSTLAAMFGSSVKGRNKGLTAYFDLEGSLDVIAPQLEALGVADLVAPVRITSWEDLKAQLDADGFEAFDNVVVDSFTCAEEMCAEFCMANVAGDSATIKQSLEQWMYGKGSQIVFDAFRPAYHAIQKHLDAGRNIVAIAHNDPTRYTNAEGADYWQEQPRLVQGEKSKAPGRSVFLEKVDHLLYLAADINVEKGKAHGGMTRTLHCGGEASIMAKSRTVQGTAFAISDGEPFDWSQIVR